jgi:hypothetical protein
MKFSIRDVLWLTVVVALAVCWGIDRAALRKAESQARLEAERALAEARRAQNLAQRVRAIAEMAESVKATP